jgi:hypothetical protein
LPACPPTIEPESDVALASHEAAEARGERLGMVARVKLAERLLAARHKPQPDPWAEIAVREGIPVRTLKYVLNRYEREDAQLGDPLAVIRQTLALFDEALEKLSGVALHADNSSAQVGAIKLLLETARGRLDLLVALGVIPREVHRLVDQEDAAQLVQRMAAIVEDHHLPELVIDELLDAVDRHVERPEFLVGAPNRR